MGQDVSQSPLAPCPQTPNCIHEAYIFDLLPSDLSDHVISALKEMEAESIDVGQVDAHEIHAVFKIWRYRDDVNVAVLFEDNKSIMFVRSASREGHSDLGVNKRRVKKFLKKLNASIVASE